MELIPTKYPELNEALGGGIAVGSRVYIFGDSDIDLGIECETVSGWKHGDAMPTHIQKCYDERRNGQHTGGFYNTISSCLTIRTKNGFAFVAKNKQTGRRDISFKI